jgi:ribosome maturation factor RimP
VLGASGEEHDVQGTVEIASDSVEGRIAALAGTEASARGLVVLDVRVAGVRSPVVTVTVDVDVADQGRIEDGAAPTDPVDIDVIAGLSRALDEALVAGRIVPEDAVLEVTSPGVERPLTTVTDLVRNLGREVELELEPSDEPNGGHADAAEATEDGEAVRGRLVAVEDGTVALVAAGAEQRIEIDRVAHARLVLPW